MVWRHFSGGGEVGKARQGKAFLQGTLVLASRFIPCVLHGSSLEAHHLVKLIKFTEDKFKIRTRCRVRKSKGGHAMLLRRRGANG